MPERSLFHLDSGDLYIADLHVGKSTVFRTQAIPIPAGDTEADLERLARALARTRARRLIILGDFLHGPDSHLESSWQTWREARSKLSVILVRGNHDVSAGDPAPHWGVDVVQDPWSTGELVLRHEPVESDQGYVLCGHLHPAIRLRGQGSDRLRLPCFHVGRRITVLPAFTQFSGGHSIRPRKSDRVFAVAEDSVLDVTGLARPK
ncbi:MAG: ligase-associated DNA damage response endonuclease PdeM [Rhodothermales bacterium]|nr:ligase-associated DNA damage response endonuclease PdeM [Rhodothermales bacterium]